MLAHYIAVVLAKVRKTPFTAAANIFTLALGLACFIAAYGIASWWRLSDHHHARAERTFVIAQGFAGGTFGEASAAPAHSTATLARYLQEDAPEVEAVARALYRGLAPFAAGERKASLPLAVVDPTFLRIFDFQFPEGDPSTALDDPRAVVLTQSAARRLFGEEAALGRAVIVDGVREGVVTGVIAPVREPSFMGEQPGDLLRFEALRSWGSLVNPSQIDGDDRWHAPTVLTFATLPPSLSEQAFQARLDALAQARAPVEADGTRVVFETRPLHALVTRDMDRRLFAEAQGVSAEAVLLGLGLLTLIIACVNYANLATAQAVGRAKEVGLRKVLGAGRAEVMAQVFLESTMATGAAVILAVAALALLAPAVRVRTGVDMLYVLSVGPAAWAVLAGLAVASGLAAGAYPALALAGFAPAEALAAGKARGPGPMARILVGVQLASASFLLILVTVIGLQRAHLEAKALSPGEDPVIVLPDLAGSRVDYETLAARLSGLPGVRSVSVTDRQPWDVARNPIYFTRSPSADLATIAAAPMAYLNQVGHRYFETAGLDLLAGQGFDERRDTIPSLLYTDDPLRVHPVVLDLTYARRLGFPTAEAAVGQLLYMPAFSNARMTRPEVTLRIVGVTEADVSRLAAGRPEGNAYVYAPAAPQSDIFPLVRIAREDVQGALARITAAWDELAPTAPADIRFVDDLFEASYERYARAGQLLMLLAAAAFAITSVGQLGIAVHVASRRRHEIGVRKTLGGTTLGIIRLLLVHFAKPALAANLLAWPLAYLAAQTYLAAFAERAPLTPAPFALSMAVTIVIAWAAVLGEVLKAASVRPAEVLRHA